MPDFHNPVNVMYVTFVTDFEGILELVKVPRFMFSRTWHTGSSTSVSATFSLARTASIAYDIQHID